jgi:hypothetical protein|tara:strand:- start:3214 stop:3567 length:354 start_codon:yes stop_codon:yes gene_type:complete
MIKIINNLWIMIKMILVMLFLLIIIKFVGTEKLVEIGLICLGFYLAYKLIDLLSTYLKNKINGIKMGMSNITKEVINPEIIYIEGLINEINKKARKTIKDKNTLDLLGIKLNQLKNV